MKISEFNEKVHIGSNVIFNGKIRKVADINRRTHEAIIGEAAIVVRCSELELYEGDVNEGNTTRMGRPPKPITAIFPDGRRVEYDSMKQATIELNIPRHKIDRVIYGKSESVNGISFQR